MPEEKHGFSLRLFLCGEVGACRYVELSLYSRRLRVVLEVMYGGSSGQLYLYSLWQRRRCPWRLLLKRGKLLNTWIKRREPRYTGKFCRRFAQGTFYPRCDCRAAIQNIQSTFKSHVTFHAKIRKVSNIDQFLTLGLVIFLVLW